MSALLSPYADGIPIVADASDRAVKFPAPALNQRVHNITLRSIERFDGGAWRREISMLSAAVLVDAPTIAVDASLSSLFTVTLGGDRTLGAPTNLQIGQRITFIITQDGTGNRFLSFDAVYQNLTWTNNGNVAGAVATITFESVDGVTLRQVGPHKSYNKYALLDATQRIDLTLVAGGFRFTIDGWKQDNVPASQAALEMTRSNGRWMPARSGGITGIVIKTTEARTAGVCTAKIFKNGGLAGAAGSQLGTLTAFLDATFPTGMSNLAIIGTFGPGEEIYATLETDAAWAPVTADVRVGIEVQT